MKKKFLMRKGARICLALLLTLLVGAGSLVPATLVYADTETLRPNAAGDYTNLEWNDGEYHTTPDPDHNFEQVDEVIADESSTYVYRALTSQLKDAYNLVDSAIPLGSTINSVTVYFRFSINYKIAYAQPFLRLDTNETSGDIVSRDKDVVGVGYQTYSQSLSRPGGGDWAVTDLNSLQVVIGLRVSYAFAYNRCTQVYVEVDYTPEPPTVTTQAVDNIGDTTATGHGTITDIGDGDVSTWGVCYNTTGNPTTANDTAAGSGAGGVGAFTASMTGLTPLQHYYVKAYATNPYGTGYGSQVEFTAFGLPSVATNNATSVEETTTTLSGNITATNGANAITRGFEWDIDTGSPYANDWHEDGDFGVEAFTHGLSLLTKGELYYYRAYATNTYGTGYGSEVTFLTKPDVPNTFVATAVSGTQIDFTWVKGTGAQKTYIRGKDGSYPTDRTDGYEVYFDTGTSANDTGLTGGHTYYYKAWSYVTDGGKEQYSDLYDSDYASPGLSVELWFQPITIITNTGVSGTADSGTNTTLVDDVLTQDNDYWNLARLIITETTDSNAPEGETAVITDFTAADDTLHFDALTAAVDTGDNYTVDFGILPDRSTSVANNGTITWGTNPDYITVTLGALLPEAQSTATVVVVGAVPDFVPVTDDDSMITSGAEGEGFPFYAMFKDLLTQWAALGGPNISMPYFWKIVAVVLGWIAGTAVMLATKNIFIGLVAYLLGFAVPAGAMGGVLDLWVPIVYGLGAIFVCLLLSKWNPSSI